MTGQELLDRLKAMTPEQLAQPIEIAVRTYTKNYPEYSKELYFAPNQSRIYCSFPEGVTISVRRKPSA